jgi:hypothetical protein
MRANLNISSTLNFYSAKELYRAERVNSFAQKIANRLKKIRPAVFLERTENVKARQNSDVAVKKLKIMKKITWVSNGLMQRTSKRRNSLPVVSTTVDCSIQAFIRI